MHRIAAVVAGLSLAFVGTSTTIAGTINVPADQPTIAAAISASVNGDVINIAAGTYNEHSLNPGGKAITIQDTLNGDGSLATTIDASQLGRVFFFNSGEGHGGQGMREEHDKQGVPHAIQQGRNRADEQQQEVLSRGMHEGLPEGGSPCAAL